MNMFKLSAAYDAEDYLIPIEDENDILQFKTDCRYLHTPCDDDVYELGKIIMDEEHLNFANDPYLTVDLYCILRAKINALPTLWNDFPEISKNFCDKSMNN